jgi:hypothetical protein
MLSPGRRHIECQQERLERRIDDLASKLQNFDPRTARELLDAAGLKPNAQGIRLSIAKARSFR